jgi:hypothetical protein
MLEMNNPEVSLDHRQAACERLKQALFSTASTLKMSLEKAVSTAAKIEESVFVATLTKNDYERMIETRINYIKNKISPGSGSDLMPPSNISSAKTTNENIMGPSSPTSAAALKYLNDEEKQFVITKLAPLQVHLPKMERLINLFKQNQLPSLSEPVMADWTESLKKYMALKGVLQKQIELFSQDSYILTPASANSLVEHVQKMTNLLVNRARTFLMPTPVQPQNEPTAKSKKTNPLLVSIELPNFTPEYIDDEKLERQLAELSPRPTFKKIIIERPNRLLLYLGVGNGDFMMRFTLVASKEITWQIERGREYFKCTHDLIGEKNLRSIWRHSIFHYNQSIKNKLSNT